MTKSDKFIKFLNTLQTSENAKLLECIKQGFSSVVESVSQNRHLVLWGIPAGETDALNERPLSVSRDNPTVASSGLTPVEFMERIKVIAGRDGWHSFRVVDDGPMDGDLEKPSFGRELLNI